MHIVGGGEWLDYYKDMAKELGISDFCYFYGQCQKDEVYSIIRQMDFGVSSSIMESAGIAVQEFLLLGKPVVVTKSGGADSLVNDSVAIVVEKCSVNSLVDGIRVMTEKYRDYDSGLIRNYAHGKFDMDVVSRIYFDLYKSVVNKKM